MHDLHNEVLDFTRHICGSSPSLLGHIPEIAKWEELAPGIYEGVIRRVMEAAEKSKGRFSEVCFRASLL